MRGRVRANIAAAASIEFSQKFVFSGNQTATELRILYRDDCLTLPLTHFRDFRRWELSGEKREGSFSNRLGVRFRVASICRRGFSAGAHHGLLAWRRFG